MILVVGYGNPLRSDDGVGPHAARLLAGHYHEPEVRILEAHQLAPELAAEAAPASLVLFLDAAVSRAPSPGASAAAVKVRPVSPGESSTSLRTHFLTPATVLRLCRDLYGGSPRGLILTITGCCFEVGEDLSGPVQAALPDMVQQARSLIERELEARDLPGLSETGGDPSMKLKSPSAEGSYCCF